MIIDDERPGPFLARVGTDGKLWAEEMHRRFPAVPVDDLLGWCCNMIMAGFDEASRKNARLPTRRAGGGEVSDEPDQMIPEPPPVDLRLLAQMRRDQRLREVYEDYRADLESIERVERITTRKEEGK